MAPCFLWNFLSLFPCLGVISFLLFSLSLSLSLLKLRSRFFFPLLRFSILSSSFRSSVATSCHPSSLFLVLYSFSLFPHTFFTVPLFQFFALSQLSPRSFPLPSSVIVCSFFLPLRPSSPFHSSLDLSAMCIRKWPDTFYVSFYASSSSVCSSVSASPSFCFLRPLFFPCFSFLLLLFGSPVHFVYFSFPFPSVLSSVFF